MAVRAAGPIFRHREPPWRRRQCCDRGGRECEPRWLYAARGQSGGRHQRDTLRQAQLRLPARYRAGRRHYPRAERHGGHPVAAGQDRPRVPRLCQGESGQDKLWVGGHGFFEPFVRRAAQDDDRRANGARPLPRRRPRADRSHRWTGAGDLLFSSVTSTVEYVKAEKVRALAVTSTARSEVLPDVPTVADFVPGYEASNWWGIAAPQATPAEIVDRLNKEINTSFADAKIKARLADLGGPPLAGSPADFRKLIADETEKWGKVIRAAHIKPE